MYQNNKAFIFIASIAFLIRFYFLSLSLAMIGVEGNVAATVDSQNYMHMASWLMGEDVSYPEGRFFDWSIGFASWLAGFLLLFNKKVFGFLIVQTIVSSISCGLLFSLTKKILKHIPTAIIAGLLLAVSWTSINLSILVLSDTFYIFLLLLSLNLLFSGIETERWKYFIAAGLLLGAAILTRTIGQFLPYMLFVLILFYVRANKDIPKWSVFIREKRPLLLKAGLTVLLAVVITFSWVARNYVKYDIVTLAYSSTRSIANTVAMTEERLTGKPFKETLANWLTDYKDSTGKTTMSTTEIFHLYNNTAKDYFKERPIEVIKTYTSTVFTNMTEINYLHRTSLPEMKSLNGTYERFYRSSIGKYLHLIFALGGIILFLWRKKYIELLLIGSLYGYHAALIGGIVWQGSRIFYPGFVFETILIAYAISIAMVRYGKNTPSKVPDASY